jgi:hypothetical protein
MNRRRRALLAVALAVALAGCGFLGGGGEIDQSALTSDGEYDWDSESTVVIDLDGSSETYSAVVDVSQQSSLGVYREDTFRGETSVPIEALQFQYPNGTVINASYSGLTASQGSDETTIELPAENGSVAFTAPREGKSWTSPAFVDGEYELRLPEGTRVGLWGLSRSTPDPDDTVVEDDQMTLYWEGVERGDPLSVRYYLVRDLYLFGGLGAIALSIGVGGLVYYYRQIRRARSKREDVGLDVEMDDDEFGDDGPPPGMR